MIAFDRIAEEKKPRIPFVSVESLAAIRGTKLHVAAWEKSECCFIHEKPGNSKSLFAPCLL
jgi:hypothetical protein